MISDFWYPPSRPPYKDFGKLCANVAYQLGSESISFSSWSEPVTLSAEVRGANRSAIEWKNWITGDINEQLG